MERQRVKKEVDIGSRVSVDRLYFGFQYGSLLPVHIKRIVGTVKHVYTSSFQIIWDIDQTVSNYVKYESIEVEKIDTPTQSLSSENEIEDVDVDVDDEVYLHEIVEDQEPTKKVKRKKRIGENFRKSVPELLKDGSDEDFRIEDLENVEPPTKVRKKSARKHKDDNVDDDEEQTKIEKKEWTKIAVGKKAADEKASKKRAKNMEEKNKEVPMKKKTKKDAKEKLSIDDYVEENILDYEYEDGDDDGKIYQPDKKQIEEERKMWKEGGWKIDPWKQSGGFDIKPQLKGMALIENKNAIDFFLHFIPMDFLRNIILHGINLQSANSTWQEVSEAELIRFLGILYSMCIYKLPEQRMYWWKEDVGPFKALDYGRYLSKSRFDIIMKNLLSIPNEDKEYKDNLILQFINAVNRKCKEVFVPGFVLAVDESMVKSFHKDLKGKQKIIRKPRPVGNEFKNVCCGISKIVTHLELYEGKELMNDKDFVSEYGATTATTLRLTEAWRNSGRVVVGDSWFGSVKTAVQLMNINGVYSNLLVKTAHKNYPRALLNNPERGSWTAATAKFEGVSVQAVKFQDLQQKQFISTCSTSLNGPPRATKHHGLVSRPQVAYDYLSYSAGIDIFNHFRTGSLGLEDTWNTKSPHIRQFAGILSFTFTNAFLAMRYFKNSQLKHLDFKIDLSSSLMTYEDVSQILTTGSLHNSQSNISKKQCLHKAVSLAHHFNVKQKYCYFCQHGRNPAEKKVKCSHMCETCEIPICSPTAKRDCWQRHILEGRPKKKYQYNY